MTIPVTDPMAARVAELEAELAAQSKALIAERIGRLAAERGLSSEQATDIGSRVLAEARLRAAPLHRDVGVVDVLFATVADDPAAAHLFEPMRAAPSRPAGGKGLGEMTMAEYRRARQSSRI